MGEDRVGPEAAPAQLQGSRGDGAAALDGFCDRRFEGIERLLLELVAHQLDPGRVWAPRQEIRLLADRHHLVARQGSVVRGEVAVLAGEVLVNEKQAHYSGSRMARRRYAVTGAKR